MNAPKYIDIGHGAADAIAWLYGLSLYTFLGQSQTL